MISSEFSIITRYFNRVNKFHLNVDTGIGDDCALVNIPHQYTLAISTDTLVCGKHFLPDINPADLAFKALAVNISDIVAMGADPAWLTLALTIPKIDEDWLEIFSNTLFDQLNYYNMQLISGDTTSGPLSITLTIHGLVPVGSALKRSNAKLGDLIYVTGTLGDSAAGLAILQNKLIVNNIDDMEYMIMRHLRPTPRITHGHILRGLANAAIDLSDGLISDIDHILQASNVGAYINLDLFPISAPMSRNVHYDQALYWAIAGGDDYELCFTIPKINQSTVDILLSNINVPYTCIGTIIEKQEGIKFVRQGKYITMPSWKGYDHFPTQIL